MPKIIIEQNKDIVNHTNMLNLPYSEDVKNHIVFRKYHTEHCGT